MSERLAPVRHLLSDAAGFGFYLCTSKELRQGRGNPFLRVMLQDATGLVEARVFEHAESMAEEFDAGEFVKASGRIELHHGRLQLVAERIRRVLPADRQDGFDERDCIEYAPRPIETMWGELMELTAAIGESSLRAVVTSLLTTHEGPLKLWPAAVAVHHAYRGGLLEHTIHVTRTARALAGSYGADPDIVIAGAILHDIGKLRELEHEVTTSYTRDGQLLGHVTLGARMVEDACEAIPALPEAVRTHLVHIVLAHHGRREHGSPVVPMTTEAFIVAAADELDAKLFQVRRAKQAEAGDGEFSTYEPRLERRIWKGAS